MGRAVGVIAEVHDSGTFCWCAAAGPSGRLGDSRNSLTGLSGAGECGKWIQLVAKGSRYAICEMCTVRQLYFAGEC